MSSPVSYITTLIRKASRANPSTHRKPGSLSRRRSGDGQGRKARRTEIIGVSQDYERQNVVISKNNNETFGFKIKTYEKNTTDSGQDILTCVSSVREKGPAERAGLRTGDLIIIINNICVEDFVHQRIVDLIHNSSSCLKLEIVRGTTLKQRELQKKLHHLQDQLREKRAELQVLISQEEHLRGGDQRNRGSQSCLAPDYLPIPSQPLGTPGPRASEDPTGG
ncbi:cytohesin-interacting protein-like [Electrophorus electricus]|uniref:PDZ domain-containing protein n=1 Tax=Electrophorus electricus TaxID=8005 RepID=A0A4W4DM63_ELEEL|nr:cytohesin-interacting protein-like [Electrophorus electricus]